MVSERGKMSRVAVVAGALFLACAGGASESEFVAACMKEGQSAASQLLDKELGVTRDAFCKCGAGVAKSSLSGDGYKAMILEPAVSSPEEFRKLIAADLARWGKVVREAGIKAQ